LKKVVLSSGNRLIYTDTYAEALAQLSGGAQQLVSQAMSPTPPAQPPPTGAKAQLTIVDPRLAQVRDRLRRYRELASQGKWSEAGKELEAIEGLVRQ
jgi:uncharacterized membrane protein (UPF0182 family)